MTKPIDFQSRIKESFSKRLINTLKSKGYISPRSSHGVSVKAVADALGCSSTMVKKYLDGESLPENKNIEKLSNWLKVDTWWLLYGDKSKTPSVQFDQRLLEAIFFEAKELLLQHTEHWGYIIKNIFEIYENIVEMDTSDDNKNNSINLMLKFLKKSLTSPLNN